MQRIEKIATNEGIKITAFEKSIGASKGVLSRAIANGTDIQTKWLQSIVEKYPRYSEAWLLTGNGSMLKSYSTLDEEENLVKTKRLKSDQHPLTSSFSDCKDNKSNPFEQEKTMLKPDPVPLMGDKAAGREEVLPKAIPAREPGEGIPLIPFSAMAGALIGEQTALEYECEKYIVPAFKGADFLIPVKGSSMYPKYSNGDIVACKRIPMGDLFFQWNKVYVIDTDQGPLIKRIKKGGTPDCLLIVSDNPGYEPFELPIDHIHAVALVIGVIRLE